MSIAAELLNDADIIFLDEPTSGLDAYTAARTIKTLKQFCLISNKMVIATIHQPSVEVFYLFDQLILLGAGRPCFAASIEDVDEYFADKWSPTQNPADVIIFEAQRDSNYYAERWANHQKLVSLPNIDGIYGKQNELNQISDDALSNNNDSASWCIQFSLLLYRELMTFWRNLVRDSLVRVIQIVSLAVLLGMAYNNLTAAISTRCYFLFIAALMVLLYALVSTVSVFPAQKLLFQRESRSGNYGVSSWALSFQIIEIPRESIFMFLFTIIATNLARVYGAHWQFFLVFMMADFAGGSLGIFCGALAKGPEEAALMLPSLSMFHV